MRTFFAATVAGKLNWQKAAWKLIGQNCLQGFPSNPSPQSRILIQLHIAQRRKIERSLLQMSKWRVTTGRSHYLGSQVCYLSGGIFTSHGVLTVALEYDMCPVCRSNTISNPGLKFKVSSKCYHRICEGCVDRHFSSGKAKCPVSRCDKHLWKREWRTQRVEDLQVERELDIRQRVIKMYVFFVSRWAQKVKELTG